MVRVSVAGVPPERNAEATLRLCLHFGHDTSYNTGGRTARHEFSGETA